eukprot:8057749-Pyramimonas_sp.AAC.1
MRSDPDGRSTQPAHYLRSAGRRRAGRSRQRRGRHPWLHRARAGASTNPTRQNTTSLPLLPPRLRRRQSMGIR